MGKSSVPLQQDSALQDGMTLSKFKASPLEGISGSTMQKFAQSHFGHAENLSIMKGNHEIQRSEQLELEEESLSKFLKDCRRGGDQDNDT